MALAANSGKKLPKPNNVMMIPTELDKDFFKWWCIFLRPFVNLTDREIAIVASFLKQRYELSKKVLDPSILDQIVMSEETKLKVQEECGISSQHLYVRISHLRKKGVFQGNSLNPKLIPNIRPDDNGVFQLLMLFKDVNKK